MGAKPTTTKAMCAHDGGCIAFARGTGAEKFQRERCTVHGRTATPAEKRWLDWANSTPRFTNPLDLLARNDPKPWYDRSAR